MGSTPKLLLASLLIPGLCFAQSPGPIDTSGWTPPPLVDAPADSPRPAAGLPGPATPPPPGYSVPPATSTPGLTPGAPGTVPPGAYPYTPYAGAGTPEQLKPGPEVGLMVSESLFGMLTSAGTALIPYYLLLKPLGASVSGGGDTTLVNLIFILTFSAVPLAVSQTEVSLANGSRYYVSEGWPAALGGLVAQAAVVGAYYWLGPGLGDRGEALLLIGTVAFVPIAEMAAINLFKAPRYRMGLGGVGGGMVSYSPEGGFQPGLPLPQPIFSRTAQGLAGVGLSLLSGRF